MAGAAALPVAAVTQAKAAPGGDARLEALYAEYLAMQPGYSAALDRCDEARSARRAARYCADERARKILKDVNLAQTVEESFRKIAARMVADEGRQEAWAVSLASASDETIRERQKKAVIDVLKGSVHEGETAEGLAAWACAEMDRENKANARARERSRVDEFEAAADEGLTAINDMLARMAATPAETVRGVALKVAGQNVFPRDDLEESIFADIVRLGGPVRKWGEA